MQTPALVPMAQKEGGDSLETNLCGCDINVSEKGLHSYSLLTETAFVRRRVSLTHALTWQTEREAPMITTSDSSTLDVSQYAS